MAKIAGYDAILQVNSDPTATATASWADTDTFDGSTEYIVFGYLVHNLDASIDVQVRQGTSGDGVVCKANGTTAFDFPAQTYWDLTTTNKLQIKADSGTPAYQVSVYARQAS